MAVPPPVRSVPVPEASARDTPADQADEPARGSTLKFLLSHTESAAEGQSSSRGAETVLLVEDEPTLRAIARVVLLQSGYAVLEAGDGREALAVAARHHKPIHLLLTDVVMPHMGGRELAEHLTAARPGLRVLFISGYLDDDILRHGVREDAINFLPKPFSPATLARKVRDVLAATA